MKKLQKKHFYHCFISNLNTRHKLEILKHSGNSFLKKEMKVITFLTFLRTHFVKFITEQ